jgi:hypothetical protein
MLWRRSVEINFPKKYWQPLTVLVAAVILLWSLYLGISHGRSQAQAESVLQNAAQLKKALNYFYNDQNRFPTAEEFADKNVIEKYAQNFPPPEFTTAACAQSFVYKRPTPGSFVLNFCLPASTGGFNSGWNQVTESK